MAIQSLFGPTPEEILDLRRQQEEKEILSSGEEFGVFAPLYRAGLRFGAQGRRASASFLGASDPMLQKATMIQSVLGKYANQDIASPAVLGNIARDFASIGATKEAFTLAQEARNAERQRQTDLRSQKVEERAQAAERRASYQFNPALAIEDASKLAEDNPERQTLLTLASRLMTKENFDIAAKQAQIKASEASAAANLAQAEKTDEGQPSETVATAEGEPLTKRGGKFYTMDGKLYKGKIQRLTTPSENQFLQNLIDGGGKTDGKTSKTQPKANPADFDPNVKSQKQPSIPEVSGDVNTNPKYIRSKGRGNTYTYTISPRGLTMDEWRSIDSRK